MPSILLLLNLLAVLATSTAAPFDPNNEATQTTKFNGKQTIDFAVKTPTCANDASFVTAKGKNRGTGAVVSKSDCDAVITNICQASIRKAYPKDHSPVDMSAGIFSRVGTCEGHIMFNWVTPPSPFTEEECTTAFTKVSNSCMVLGDASIKNSAVAGRQAGVMNAYWSEDMVPYWWAYPIHRVHGGPGYLLGPLGYYGDLGDLDAASVPGSAVGTS